MPDNEIRSFSLEEFKNIHKTYMRRDFPISELRPVSSVEKLWQRGVYKAYGYYRDGSFMAYACLYSCSRDPYALLDYLAVVPEMRDKGIGSSFLQDLKPVLTQWDGILIEAENAKSAKNDNSRQERKRRLAFYQKNGAIYTGTNCLLFGVDYEILYYPCGQSLPSVNMYDMVCSAYHDLYGRFCGTLCRLYQP